MDGGTNGAAVNQAALAVPSRSEPTSGANEALASVPASLPSLPTVPSFDECDHDNGPHEGLLRLTQANTLLGKSNIEDVRFDFLSFLLGC